MEVLSRSKKGFALLLAMLAVFAFAGTALADDADTFLDHYEKFVVKTEELAKQDAITSDQANDFLKSYQEFAAKAEKMKESGAPFSEAQTKRATSLSHRLETASRAFQPKQQK